VLIAWLNCFWTRLTLRQMVSAVCRVRRPYRILLPSLEFAQLSWLEFRGFLNTPPAGQTIARLCPHHLTLTKSDSLERLLLFFKLKVPYLAKVRLADGGLDWLRTLCEIWKLIEKLKCIEMVKRRRMMKGRKWISLLELVLRLTQCF